MNHRIHTLEQHNKMGQQGASGCEDCGCLFDSEETIDHYGSLGFIEVGHGDFRGNYPAVLTPDGLIKCHGHGPSWDRYYQINMRDCEIQTNVPQDPRTDGTAVWWPLDPNDSLTWELVGIEVVN